jgi:uncharacterized repeat protein (TIGR03837 family)
MATSACAGGWRRDWPRAATVRLWVDDASALAWMAPRRRAGVEVLRLALPADPQPGDVVIEAFGCDPPRPSCGAMAARRPAPVWINLEYLSAEPYVERSHGLPSPQPNGLTKWFFYPGFTARTGGLLREPGARRDRAFDGAGVAGARRAGRRGRANAW